MLYLYKHSIGIKCHYLLYIGVSLPVFETFMDGPDSRLTTRSVMCYNDPNGMMF